MTKKQRRNLRKQQLKQRNIELKNINHKRESEGEVSLNGNKMHFCMVSKDNSGMRYNWREGEEYEEVLEPNGAIVRDNLTFFKNHRYSVENAIGSVDNVRVEDGELLSDVKFSADEDAQKIRAKYEEGTLTGVSIGYEILEYKTEQREGKCDLVTVTKYIIKELSAVGLPFDEGANKREADILTYEKQIERNKNMNKQERIAQILSMAKRSKEDDVELQRLQSEVLQEQKQKLEEFRRKDSIRTIAQEYDVDDALTQRALKDDKMSEDAFKTAILDSRKADTPPMDNSQSDGDVHVRQIEDALAIRMMGKTPEGADTSLVGASLCQLTRHLFPDIPVNATDMQIAERAMGSFDMPNMLLGAGNKMILELTKAKSIYQEMTFKATTTDMRPNAIYSIVLSDTLDEIAENGEFKDSELVETGRYWTIKKFGKQFKISIEMFINDDIGILQTFFKQMAMMSIRTKDDMVCNILEEKGKYEDYLMEDGLPIFHVDHGNITSDALSFTSLSTGRTSMAKQKIEGVHLGLEADTIFIATDLETTAEELINSPSSTKTESNSGNINPFYKKMKIIVSSRLEAGRWYLKSGDAIGMGELAGTGGMPKTQKYENNLTSTTYQTMIFAEVFIPTSTQLYAGGRP